MIKKIDSLNYLYIHETVETQFGVKPLIKLKINDEISTVGGWKKVTQISPIITQPTYKIILKSGKTISCSRNQKFPLNLRSKIKSLSNGLHIGNKLLVLNKETTNKANLLLKDEIVNIIYKGSNETIGITIEDAHMFFCNDIYTH